MASELRRAGGFTASSPLGSWRGRGPTRTSPVCQQSAELLRREPGPGAGPAVGHSSVCLSICLSLLRLSRTHPFRHLSHQQGLRLCAGPPSTDRAQTIHTSAACLPRGLSTGVWAPCLSTPCGPAAVLRRPPPWRPSPSSPPAAQARPDPACSGQRCAPLSRPPHPARDTHGLQSLQGGGCAGGWSPPRPALSARGPGTGGWAFLSPHGPRTDRKSTRLNSSHTQKSRMPSSA